MVHVNQRDVTMVCVSRTALDRIDAYKRRMGWQFAWVSSLNSDFNYDFGVSFTEDQQRNGAEYNFRWEQDPGEEGHGLSSFALEDGALNHVYSTYVRGNDAFKPATSCSTEPPKGATKTTSWPPSSPAMTPRPTPPPARRVRGVIRDSRSVPEVADRGDGNG
jgi:predicted dithiol-disulfide oxidoreductase (DUF899 family)